MAHTEQCEPLQKGEASLWQQLHPAIMLLII